MARKKKEEKSMVKVTEMMVTAEVQVQEIEWNSHKLKIRNALSFDEAVQMVEDIVSTCFTEDHRYTPIALDFAIRLSTICRYANIEPDGSANDQYMLAMNTDIYEVVCNHINTIQLGCIIAAAKSQVQHLCGQYNNYAVSRINEMMLEVTKIGEKLSSLVENIDEGDLEKVVKAIGENGIDPDAIVNAYTKTLNTSEKTGNAVGV